MQDFKKWMTGELQRQNGNCSRAENAVDFRKRDSRSIWRSEPRLSVVEFCWLGQGCLLSEKCPSRFVSEILAKRPEEYKILIIISDGLPNSQDYAGERLASAPLHKARKTRKFGTMLKAEIGREQLAFGSDNLSANFNA